MAPATRVFQAETLKPAFDPASAYERLFERWGPQGWWPGENEFEIVVGALLAQATSWRNAEAAVNALKLAGLLEPRDESVKRIIGLPDHELQMLIKPSGYFRQKTQRLKALLEFLSSNLGTMPWRIAQSRTLQWRERFLSIKGLGPETVDSILLYGFGLPVFVVDAYTRRVLSRHGMIGATASYDEIQSLFVKKISARSEIYNEYHALLVRLGKEHCRSGACCAGCPLA
jgi:endonuclease-3 related protein